MIYSIVSCPRDVKHGKKSAWFDNYCFQVMRIFPTTPVLIGEEKLPADDSAGMWFTNELCGMIK
jgi:hypothetical protein